MGFVISEEQQAIKKTVRDFMQKECPVEKVKMWEETASFPDDVWKKMAEIGLLSLPIPEKYGGVGGSIMDMTILVEELGYNMLSMAHMYVMSNLFGSHTIELFGTEEQKKMFFPKMMAGEWKFCMSLTEPNAGSDVASMKTKAVLDGDHYVVNGAKIFSTGAHLADWILLVVRTSSEGKKHQGLSMFVVDPKTPGIKINPLKHMGCMAVHTDEVSYEDVRVPKENLIGKLNQAWYQVLAVLEAERIFTAAQCVGLAQRAFDDALEYAKQREQFGQPIGKFQAISHMFAEAATDINASRLMTYQAAWLLDNKMPSFIESSMAKLKASETCKDVALKGCQIMGGYGYMNEFEMQRYLRESIITTVFGGSSQIQKNIIAGSYGL